MYLYSPDGINENATSGFGVMFRQMTSFKKKNYDCVFVQLKIFFHWPRKDIRESNPAREHSHPQSAAAPKYCPCTCPLYHKRRLTKFSRLVDRLRHICKIARQTTEKRRKIKKKLEFLFWTYENVVKRHLGRGNNVDCRYSAAVRFGKARVVPEDEFLGKVTLNSSIVKFCFHYIRKLSSTKLAKLSLNRQHKHNS